MLSVVPARESELRLVLDRRGDGFVGRARARARAWWHGLRGAKIVHVGQMCGGSAFSLCRIC